MALAQGHQVSCSKVGCMSGSEARTRKADDGRADYSKRRLLRPVYSPENPDPAVSGVAVPQRDGLRRSLVAGGQSHQAVRPRHRTQGIRCLRWGVRPPPETAGLRGSPTSDGVGPATVSAALGEP